MGYLKYLEILEVRIFEQNKKMTPVIYESSNTGSLAGSFIHFVTKPVDVLYK